MHLLLQNVINEFLINQEIKGNSKSTLDYYALTLGYFLDFMGADKPVPDIILVDLNNYYLHLKKRNVSSVTLQTYMRAVRSFLNWCYDEGYMPVKLSDRFKLPKAERKVFDVLTDYEIERLFGFFDIKQVLGLRDWCICALMLDCGLRKNEVVTMTFSRYRGKDGYIIVQGKGNRQRVVPLGLKTRKHLAKYEHFCHRHGTESMFLTKDGLPITKSTVKQLFSRLKTETGIQRLHPHLLRHTFATRFIENGGDVFTLQHLLGHSTLDMSKKYLHLSMRNTLDKFKAFSPLDNIGK